MSSIVVNPKDKNELKFVFELLEKMKISARVVSQSEMQDLGLAALMKDVDRTDVVSEDEILAKLKRG